MKTHTLRNKATSTPILTLTPKFFAKAMACYPEAFCLALNWFYVSYKSYRGVTPRLDHTQQQAFLARAGADERGLWSSKFSSLSPAAAHVVAIFTSGFTHTSGLEFESALDLAQEFYAMLDKNYFSAESSV